MGFLFSGTHCIMRKVWLERYYFVLYDGALTLKMSKMALNPFCDKTLHFLIMLQLCLRVNSSFWLWVLSAHCIHRMETYPQSEESYVTWLKDFINQIRQAGRPLCQSPAVIPPPPLINTLKTINHYSPTSWETINTLVDFLSSGWTRKNFSDRIGKR